MMNKTFFNTVKSICEQWVQQYLFSRHAMRMIYELVQQEDASTSKVNKVEIRYLQTDVLGQTSEFISMREVGQIIEDSGFQGLIYKVLEIIVCNR